MLVNWLKFLNHVFKSLIFFIGSFILVGLLSKFYRPGVTKSYDRMSEVGGYILKKIKSYNPENVLCAFDIDLTLIQPDHPACYVPNIRKHLKIYRNIEFQYPKLDTSIPFSYTFLEPQHVVDTDIYILLEQLKAVHKIAFTATLTGEFQNIGRLEVIRYQQLWEKQLQFQSDFKGEDFVLDACPSYRNNKPAFYKGVLCSNSENGTTTKGDVLCAFLKKIQWTPEVVILVDDRSKNLNDAAVALKKNFPSVKFIGIEYLGAHNYCPQTITKEGFKAYWSHLFSKAQAHENL